MPPSRLEETQRGTPRNPITSMEAPTITHETRKGTPWSPIAALSGGLKLLLRRDDDDDDDASAHFVTLRNKHRPDDPSLRQAITILLELNFRQFVSATKL